MLNADISFDEKKNTLIGYVEVSSFVILKCVSGRTLTPFVRQPLESDCESKEIARSIGQLS